ncbi:MAG: hypothetical protein SWO11_15255 [Thermodesulfobacteriota bacterium]|nr:hypothetical protein [Thermodesulfobacteriota bacterium]
MVVGTSPVAYAEASSAFALRFRGKASGINLFSLLKLAFDNDWDDYLIEKVTDGLVYLD